jgi:hypothetical protein
VKKARALIKERYQGGRREGGRGRELLGEAAAAEEGKVGVMGFSAGKKSKEGRKEGGRAGGKRSG